jgi:hypothetical protein
VDFYNSESASIVKLAPQLSQKVLFPSNFERQNVQYAVNLFNEKNIAALSTTGFGTVGLVNFMKRITSWWNIVNVKTLFKGQAKRLDEASPVCRAHDESQNGGHFRVRWLVFAKNRINLHNRYRIMRS